jgi:hypothetical protein
VAEEILRLLVLFTVIATILYVCGLLGIQYRNWRKQRNEFRDPLPQPQDALAAALASMAAKLDFENPDLVRGYDSPELCREDASIRSEQQRLQTKVE